MTAHIVTVNIRVFKYTHTEYTHTHTHTTHTLCSERIERLVGERYWSWRDLVTPDLGALGGLYCDSTSVR
jgi:hypothetical protein